MLTIVIPAGELWDSENERMIRTSGATLKLEHTLVTLSKWEARFEKPFLSNEKKTVDETYGYIQEMAKKPIDKNTLMFLTEENMQEVNKFIEAKNTATWFKEAPNGPRNREIVTSEIIYHWMFALQIPIETENWHLNKLFTQIKVVSEKNQKPKKMSRAETIARQRSLNAERLAAMNTAG